MNTIPNLSNIDDCVKYIFSLEHEIINKDLLISDLQADINLQKTIVKGLQLLSMSYSA